MRFLQRRALVDGLIPHQRDLGLAIRHGDLNACNVLVNRDKLSGTIDWDTASFVPAPAAVQHPVFMADIPGYRLGDVPEGMEFADDRGYLESAMRKVSPDAGDVADLLATSFERQFLELSLRNKKINEQYVRLRLGDAEIDKAALNAHLDQFLLTNMGMEAHPTILDMREQLAVHERA